MNELNYVDIVSGIKDINEGDILYVVSDILNLAKAVQAEGHRFDINLFIDSIINKVGPSGTVLIPTFNWDFCKGKPFDIRKTPSHTGAMGNAALKRADFKRTQHPIYSFAVWGKDSKRLCELDEKKSFGEGTIFDYLHKNKGKALIIDLTCLAGLTFLHHVEKCVGVPYRYEKTFKAKYIDMAGNENDAEYTMYVRDLDIDPRAKDEGKFDYLSNLMEQLNISRTEYYKGIPFRTVYLEGVYSVLECEFKYNVGRNAYDFIGIQGDIR